MSNGHGKRKGKPVRTVFLAGSDATLPSPLPPPDPDYPNEPAGATVLAYAPWDVMPNPNSGTTPPGWVNPWTEFEPFIYTEIINDATAPTGNGKCLRITYPDQWDAGSATAHFWTNWENTHGQVSELYMSMWFRIYGNGTDYENNTVGTKALFYSGPTQSGGQNAFYPLFKGDGTTNPMTSMQNWQYLQGVVGGRAIGPNVNMGNLVIVGSTWQRWEWYCRTNTLGVDDGLLKMWIDGEMTHNYSDVRWRNNVVGENFKFRNFNLNPTYGGGGSTKTRDDYYDISEIYISGID